MTGRDGVPGRQTENEYVDLLTGVEEVTDRLIDAARRSDIKEFDLLIQSRQLLLDELSVSARQMGARSAEFQEMQERVLRKQAECEQLMVAGLRECRSGLMNLRKHRGIRSMYKMPVATIEPPRFLDRKL